MVLGLLSIFIQICKDKKKERDKFSVRDICDFLAINEEGVKFNKKKTLMSFHGTKIEKL